MENTNGAFSGAACDTDGACMCAERARVEWIWIAGGCVDGDDVDTVILCVGGREGQQWRLYVVVVGREGGEVNGFDVGGRKKGGRRRREEGCVGRVEEGCGGVEGEEGDGDGGEEGEER